MPSLFQEAMICYTRRLEKHLLEGQPFSVKRVSTHSIEIEIDGLRFRIWVSSGPSHVHLFRIACPQWDYVCWEGITFARSSDIYKILKPEHLRLGGTPEMEGYLSFRQNDI